MSQAYFGDDTFKQRVLDYILDQVEIDGIDSLVAVEHVLEVVSHLISSAFRREDEIGRIYKMAKEDALAELMKKLKS